MVTAILILTFATSLKNMTGVLGAKPFVAAAMSGVAGEFAMFLPAIIFLVACGISFATGTSWGTFGILIPIVIAIFPLGTIQTIGISACLAGSVFGDNCSPISDTTIMSSAGGQCNHINHVSTQLPYAISVVAISFVMYIITDSLVNFNDTPLISFNIKLHILYIGIIAFTLFFSCKKKKHRLIAAYKIRKIAYCFQHYLFKNNFSDIVDRAKPAI